MSAGDNYLAGQRGANKTELRGSRTVEPGLVMCESIGVIGHQHVQTDVEVECRAEALDEGDDTGLGALAGTA